MFLLLLTSTSFAADWTVGVSSSADFAEIQDAVEAAASGDSITVEIGEYTACVNTRGKDLVIDGAGSDDVFLAPAGTCQAALSITQGETVTLSRLEISNGAERAVLIEDSTVSFLDVTVRDSGEQASASDIHGGGVRIIGGTLTIDDSVIEGNRGHYGANFHVGGGATVTITDSTIADGYGAHGGAIFVNLASEEDGGPSTVQLDNVDITSNNGGIHVHSGVLESTNSRYTENGTEEEGGVTLYAYGDSTVTSTGDRFEGNGVLSRSGTGAVYVADSALVLIDASFEGNAGQFGGALTAWGDSVVSTTNLSLIDNAAYYGGAVFTYDGVVLTDDGSSFEGNSSNIYGGAMALSYDSVVSLNGTRFTGNSSVVGGALAILYGATVDADGLSIQDNVADNTGGGVYIDGAGSVTATHNWLCGNQARQGGAVHSTGTTGGTTWTNSAFIENGAVLDGGGVYVQDDSLQLVNSVLLGNQAETGGALHADRADVTLLNSLLAWTVDGGAVYAADSSSAASMAVTYNAWHDNSGGDATGDAAFDTSADGNISGDPLLFDYSDNGDCSDDLLFPQADSPLIDAGDPDLFDPDGSVSDIGLYGGPNSLSIDADGDGFFDLVDCDDSDAEVHPDADDIAYDGIDNDCVDGDLTDVDGDGYVGDEAGGDDCRDTDPDVHPGAAEIADDGIDQDCDGADATSAGDGGTTDGGATDGGSPDGGGSEGGVSDGGVSDGGTSDGGGSSDSDDLDPVDTGKGCAAAGTGGHSSLAALGLLGLVALRRRAAGVSR